MIPNQTTGTRIRYYRKLKNLTQKKLGEMIGVGESTIRNYELGNRVPDLKIIMQIADALEVSFFTLDPPSALTPAGALHFFFEMERDYELTPVEIDGKVYISVEGAESRAKTLQHYLNHWYAVKSLLSEGSIDDERYEEWQSAYPNYAGLNNENDIMIGKDEFPEYVPNYKEQTIEDDYELDVTVNKWGGADNLMSLEEYKKWREDQDKNK